ncbi:phosphotransferase [Paenibacillus sp. PR3]|uniref:Phosphotransferase n=1 Tax=Paenibacillus terricola TaxID=2763503 RepID=A0ABR8MSE0_9BACL|nr:phosphotransferase [Paenibacillus terricola]MBD3918887.1 phosphotransferase [Paenibacillus terricola]
MSETMTTPIPFHKLCSLLSLGEIQGEPRSLSGGFMHQMYGIETSQGRYAIKVLNPMIMQRPTAKANFIRSEQIASMAANVVPAAPAIQRNGDSLHYVDDHHMQAFGWVQGVVLNPDAITVDHCITIGSILADLHLADFTSLSITYPISHNVQEPTDWTSYLAQGEGNRAIWVEMMAQTIDNLYKWDAQANVSVTKLTANTVISHNDLDPKNVLWYDKNPTIIDWECANYVNPMQDLIETALYWATDGNGTANQERFLAFIQAYSLKIGPLVTDWHVVLSSGFAGKLGWLAYNLRRSLGIESSDAAEQELGTEQVKATLDVLHQYAEQLKEIELWLHSIE